ncbi:Uncharacterised protein [Mycobacteroides abscessus subsp. abscessus]|nr:Uncharacterised protein [Mycobacteroides abscessus subsp. abscessus]
MQAIISASNVRVRDRSLCGPAAAPDPVIWVMGRSTGVAPRPSIFITHTPPNSVDSGSSVLYHGASSGR